MNKLIVSENTFSFKSMTKGLFQVKEITILLIVLALSIALSIASEFFLTVNNMLIIFNGLALDMIIATSMTISLIGGHIDFSVGSILGCTGFLAGMLMQAGAPIWIAALSALGFGILLGFINGFLIVKLKVIPIEIGRAHV